MFAAGFFEFSAGWLLGIMVVVLPIFAWTSLWALAVGLGMFAALFRFLLSEEHRFEALLALAELTGVQTFLFLAGSGANWPDLLGWLRIAAALAVLPAIYFALRFYARRQLLALERQIEEDRRARMEQEREQARLERQRIDAGRGVEP